MLTDYLVTENVQPSIRNHPSMSTHGMPSAAQASGIATRGEVRTLIRNDHHTARPHACVALAFLDLY